jgi:hypothetical protein
VATTKDLIVGLALLFTSFVLAFYELGYTYASPTMTKEFILNIEYVSIALLIGCTLSGFLIGRYLEKENSKKKPKSQTGTPQFF